LDIPTWDKSGDDQNDEMDDFFEDSPEIPKVCGYLKIPKTNIILTITTVILINLHFFHLQ
jgi:hypothetical protein